MPLDSRGFPIINYRGQAASNIMIPRRGGAINARQQRLQTANPTRFSGGTQPLAPKTPAAPSDANTQIAHLEANIKKFGAKNRPNDVKRLAALRGGLPQAPVSPVEMPTANPIQPQNFSNIAAGSPAVGTANVDVNTLFPSTRMFEPKNYEGSPLYQFQVKEGQKQLGKSLAARGLTNSGHAIEEELNIPMRAAAQDTDRMTRVASENADRLKSFQDNEALRQERAGNNQWDRTYSLAELMSRQSPWTGALAGLNNSADVTSEAGRAQANYLADAYRRVIASGGGGGGGGGNAGTPIPLPTGPDYSNIAPTQIGGNYSSNSGWLNLLTQGLSNFFPAPAANTGQFKIVPA